MCDAFAFPALLLKKLKEVSYCNHCSLASFIKLILNDHGLATHDGRLLVEKTLHPMRRM